MLMNADGACLLIVDVQQRLLDGDGRARAVMSGCNLMMKAAGVMNVPIVVTEQYPEGLGPTVETAWQSWRPKTPSSAKYISRRRRTQRSWEKSKR